MALDRSTQVDSPTTGCTAPHPNETSIAQSSDDPDFVVVSAQASMESSGNCGEVHPWVFYSHDGGQHWKEEIVPGLTAGLAGGDPSVVYDPKDHVFVYSFLQFSRTDSTNTLNVTRSFDGATWSSPLTLDSRAGLDKGMITVDRNPASPHFGRVLVAWRDSSVGASALIDAFSDNGGGSWAGSSDSINTVPDCGNGASPAFDANGEAMVAWLDCDGGDRIEEELSTDGGASWLQSSNTVISGLNPIATEIDTPSACKLNAGGSDFRCNSFPSLAGDPNPLDAGGRAFFVVFANWESTTQAGQTANVSQLHGVSTVDGGATWNGGGGFAFAYMAFPNFGDKFFPWASFSPSGRLNVGYSDREADASASNPNGLAYNEGQAEASSLTSLRADSYIAYTADGQLGNPGSVNFIGDYAGIESQDNDFDTFPVWTDMRNFVGPDVRTMDLCYIDCPAFLHPATPSGALHSPGQSFNDFYQFNTDSDFGGAGTGRWNAVGIRETSTGINDAIGLASSRYFSPLVARGDLPAPDSDYVLENDNGGHGPSKPYYVVVQPSGSAGGSYNVQWDSGNHSGLSTSLSTSMSASDIINVFQMADSTGAQYHVGLRPNAGNTSNYRLSVHLNGNGTYQASGQEVASSVDRKAGSPEFVLVITGASPTGNDALVVQNLNGGSGGFTLYRDTAAPTGTISINSGATSTSSPNVTLNLSAANPTAGDPVVEMRFSSDDGNSFGRWMPFAASAPFTLPSGDGPKNVFVQYRNGAGAISGAVSASIILNTAAAISSSPAR